MSSGVEGGQSRSPNDDLDAMPVESSMFNQAPLRTGSLSIPACWICLDEGDSTEKGKLINPCSCSRVAGRYAHSRCLARWQLQSAGTKRESHCDFCGDKLPPWKDALTPCDIRDAPAIMNVCFNGRSYSFQVQPGPEGYKEFTQAITRAFGLPVDAELNITFTCDEPSTGEDVTTSTTSSGHIGDAGSLLTLQGAGAYDAAVHCASVSAARRQLTTPTSSPSCTRRSSAMDSTTPLSPISHTAPGVMSHSPASSREHSASSFGSSAMSSPNVSHSSRSVPTSPRDTSLHGNHPLSDNGVHGHGHEGGRSDMKSARSLGQRIRSALNDLFQS